MNAMNLCQIETDKLRPNPRNPFRALEEPEYLDLKNSIASFGIQDPLIVSPNGDGTYLVLSGHNRLRVAKELEMKTLPCVTVELGQEEAAYDAEIFRRHLTKDQVKTHKRQKLQRSREAMEGRLRDRLHPEFLSLYQSGNISIEKAIQYARLPMDIQATLLDMPAKEVVKEVNANGEELSAARVKIEEMQTILIKNEKDLKEMRQRELEAGRRLKAKMAELEELRTSSELDAVTEKQYKEEIEELNRNLREMSLSVQEKAREVEKADGDKGQLKRNIEKLEADVKTYMYMHKELQDKYNSLVSEFSSPDRLTGRLANVEREVNGIYDYAGLLRWDIEVVEQAKEAAERVNQKLRKLIEEISENAKRRDPGAH